jgi:hypothetical protein
MSINSLIVMVQDKNFVLNSVVPFYEDIIKWKDSNSATIYFKYFNTTDIGIGLNAVLILKGILF